MFSYPELVVALFSKLLDVKDICLLPSLFDFLVFRWNKMRVLYFALLCLGLSLLTAAGKQNTYCGL